MSPSADTSSAHHLCRFDELEDGAVARFEVSGRELSVVRIGDDVYALGDRCSHQDVSLSMGEVDADECVLECPKHGAGFDLLTGAPTSLPATRPVPVYEVRVLDGEVSVVVGPEDDETEVSHT